MTGLTVRKPHLVHVVAGDGYIGLDVECLAGDDPDRSCRAGDECGVKLMVDDIAADASEMLRLPMERRITGPIAVLAVVTGWGDDTEIELHPWSDRPWTPDEKITNEDGTTSTRFTVKTVCTGCDALLGDVTDEEIALAIEGRGRPDTRHECPFCSKDGAA